MPLALFVPLLFLAMACTPAPIIGPDGCLQVKADDAAYPPARQDDYILDTAWVASQELTAVVWYGGGCGEVTFDSWGERSFEQGNTVHYRVFLTLKDDDNCEALLLDTLCINLSEFGHDPADTSPLTLYGPQDTISLSW